MPSSLISQIKRKASHRSKETCKLRFHVVVYSVTGAPRNVPNAIWTLSRGDHLFESNTAAQSDGSFFWNERISQAVTLYRNEDESFEEKEYKLVLHEVVTGSKGDRRGASFGRGRINLAKYAGATVGKRVVLTLTPEGAAVSGGEARAMTAVVTVAAEPTDKTPTGSSAALDELSATSAADRALNGHDDDDEDEEDGAPAGAKPSPFDIGGSSDEDNDDSGQSTPHARVAPAAGAPKPLPPPPPPKQLVAKVVEWRGVGAGTVRETRRLFALCCPCLHKTDSFQPLQ